MFYNRGIIICLFWIILSLLKFFFIVLRVWYEFDKCCDIG